MKNLLIVIGLLIVPLTHAQEKVKWYTIEQALALNKKAPRKILIDVYTDWCEWCKVMDRKTYSNAEIAKYINETYYPVKFNAEQKADVIIGNDTLHYVSQGNNRGYNQFAAALLNGHLGYPSIVFLDESFRSIHVQQGYTQAKVFDEIIHFIGDDYYKHEKWNTWVASYKSPIK